MRRLRGLWRLARVLVHVLWGAALIVFEFPRRSPEERERRVQWWAAGLLRLLGVRLKLRGRVPAAGPLLMIANHISWLDIVVLHAARHCRFVSKDDVRGWPLVGLLATGAGTLYVRRSSARDAMRVVHHMAQALREGDVLAVFPEGTTSDGHGVLPFHANLLQAAVSTDTPVLPLALDYTDGHGPGPSRAVSYVGDDSLLGSLWRTLCADRVVASVHFGEAQQAGGRDRRAWARDLREAVLALRQA